MSSSPPTAPPTPTPAPPPRRRVRLKVVAMVAGCLTLGLFTTVAVAWGCAAWVIEVPIDTRRILKTEGAWLPQDAVRRADGTLPAPRDAVAIRYVSRAGFGAKRKQLSASLKLHEDGGYSSSYLGQELCAGVRDWLSDPTLEGALFPGTPGPDLSVLNRLPFLLIWAQDARGWPFLALWCEWQSDTAPNPPDSGSQSSNLVSACKGGIDLPTDPGAVRDSRTARALPLRPLYPGFIANTLIYAAAWCGFLLLPSFIRRTARRRRGLCPRCAYDLRGLPARSPCPECGAAAPTPQA